MPRSTVLKLISYLIAAFTWWKSEITSILPNWLLFVLFGTSPAKILQFSDQVNSIKVQRGQLLAPTSLLSVGGAPTMTKSAVVDVIIPQAYCLERDITLPEMSRKNLVQAIALDTQHSTPFKTSEILWSFDKSKTGEIKQFIFRRSDAIALEARLKQSGLTPRQLSVENCDGPALIDFGANTASPYRVWHRINAILIVAILAVSAMLIWQPIASQRDALQQLNTDISDLRTAALKHREDLTAIEGEQQEKAEFLLALSKQNLLVDLLRELTVRLPDTVWLTNIQIQGEELILSGTVKGSAAELVLTIAQSSTFVNPRLSGPVSKGQTPDTENFEIAATVRQDGL